MQAPIKLDWTFVSDKTVQRERERVCVYIKILKHKKNVSYF